MSLAADVLAGGTAAAPSNWERRRLRDLVRLVNGYPFPSESFGPDGDIPLVRIRDLVTPAFETYVSGDVPRQAMMRDGDVVVGMDGDFNVVVWQRDAAALNQRLCLLRPREAVDMRFIAYALPSILKVINDLTFSTTVKHLSSGDLLNERLLVPPLEEQRRIADFLDAETARIDAITAARRRTQALLELRRERLIEKILRLDGETQEAVPLRYLVREVTVGIVVTPAAWYVEIGGVPALRGVNVKAGRIVTDELVRISSEGHLVHKKSRLSAGDLVVVRTGQAGTAAVVPQELEGGNCIDLVVVRPSRSLLPKFAEYVLNSDYAKRWVTEYSVGSIQSHFNVAAMKTMPMPKMSIEDQRCVVAEIDRSVSPIEDLVRGMKTQERLLSERRQALIAAAVTGQVDVTTARGVDA